MLFVTPEISPWAKTGGLGDVSAMLPQALRAQGVDVRVLLPAYPALLATFPAAACVAEIQAPGGALAPSRLLHAVTATGLPLLLIDCPAYFARPGTPYQAANDKDWPDNHLRFALLSKIAALLGSDASPLDWRPDVLHCHDWQTALAPAYLHFMPGRRAVTLLTLHNLAFQGVFEPQILNEIGLPPQSFQSEGVEFHGKVSYLKGGIHYADRITAVSPTYAREIQRDALGFGLDGLLRHRAAKLTGILNGIDDETWNPARDPLIAASYDAAHLEQKAVNKATLQQQLGLKLDPAVPLLGIVSRLTQQKGLDWLIEIAPQLAALPVQWAVLGQGEEELEKAFMQLAARYPRQFAVRIDFDETLAHRIEAGADIFLMPSRFEPCGLNQMYSLRYGTPPLVRATGGLTDTVVDCNVATLKAGTANGFVFVEQNSAALLTAIRRAVAIWRDKPAWRQLQQNGMAQDFGWRHATAAYLLLYEKILAKNNAGKTINTPPTPKLCLIAARARNGVIGNNNTLPWRLPADLKRFKALTLGNPIIMGRKTWESLGRPLPGRQNIVLTRDPGYTAPGCTVAHSLQDALDACANAEQAFVIGGADLYAQALPLASKLYLTEVAAEVAGDAWFPQYDINRFREISRDHHAADGKNEWAFDFVEYERQ